MDRFSIIQKQLFDQRVDDENNICGQEQCECNEDSANKILQFRKANVALLMIIATMAFVTAFVFANKTNAANAKLFAKRYTVISCYSKIGSTTKSSNKKLPGDKNNENNCSHQQGSLCDTNSSKRKLLKTHNC